MEYFHIQMENFKHSFVEMSKEMMTVMCKIITGTFRNVKSIQDKFPDDTSPRIIRYI